MKNYLSVFLATWMAVGTSYCSRSNGSKNEPKPTKPATQEQIQATESGMNDESNASADVNDASRVPAGTAYINNALSELMASNDLFIMDSQGNKKTLDEYKLNPTQYFLLFRDKDAEGDDYRALRASTGTQSFENVNPLTNPNIDISFDIYDASGDMTAFKAADLGDPTVTEMVTISINPLKWKDNKLAFQDLSKRLEESAELAYGDASFLNQVSDFLFPTAHAASYKDKLLYTAITATVIAVVSWIFAWWPVGTISTGVSIVFWLLYAFE